MNSSWRYSKCVALHENTHLHLTGNIKLTPNIIITYKNPQKIRWCVQQLATHIHSENGSHSNCTLAVTMLCMTQTLILLQFSSAWSYAALSRKATNTAFATYFWWITFWPDVAFTMFWKCTPYLILCSAQNECSMLWAYLSPFSIICVSNI